MPKGNTMPIPKTATSAGLLGLIGSLLMLLGMLFGHRSFRTALLDLLIKDRRGNDEYLA